MRTTGRALEEMCKKVHESLSSVWPKSKDEPSFPDDVHTPILTNEYYLCSMPTTHCDGHFNGNILFLAESPAFTPLPSLGQPYNVRCINDAVLHTMHTLLGQHHVGHINLVHCPTYGELPFIQLNSAQMISKGEECSIDTGTPQFWKTMLVLSGYFDCYANREEKDDPLWNVLLFRDSFEFLIGKRNEKSMEARARQIIQRIQVLENVKRRGVILADVCPVPIYSGIRNTVMRINQSMGLPYKDQGIKFEGNSKQQIIKAAWASYGVDLVKHYKPRHLVILGKGVHEAIGQDELQSVMQGMGGEYLGYIKHPSWNGHYGYKIMPLLCKL